jgi:hypothetical protein
MIVLRFLRLYQRQHHFSRRPDDIPVGSPDSNAYGGLALYNPNETVGLPDAEAEYCLRHGIAERVALNPEKALERNRS